MEIFKVLYQHTVCKPSMKSINFAHISPAIDYHTHTCKQIKLISINTSFHNKYK